jgi:hypothetical protein
MSGSTWNSFRGVCGHLHVPENTHRDPGDISIKAIIDAAKGGVEVSKQDVINGLKEPIVVNVNTTTGKKFSVAGILSHMEDAQDEHGKRLNRLVALNEGQNTALDALQQALAAIAAGSSEGVKLAFDDGIARLAAQLAQLKATITFG